MTIFRKVALDRLASPDQLDQLVRVTDSRGWIALSALGLVCAVIVGWGFFGSIPTEAIGEGILLRESGISEVISTADGQVERLEVDVGDPVAKGQIIAFIRQEGLSRQRIDAIARRDAAQLDYQNRLAYADQQARLASRSRAQEKANLERIIATLKDEASILEQRLANERMLLQQGLLTRQAVLKTEQEVNAVRQRLDQARFDLDALPLTILEAEQARQKELDALAAVLKERELALRELEARLDENVAVTSPFAGRVLELLVDRGDLVTPGVPILSLESPGDELMALLYVPAATGKLVREGMETRVSPLNVKKEEFGYLLGQVTRVSSFPATPRGMLRRLGNQKLVDRLMGEGAPIQVEVRLRADPSTPSGFTWSSSRGPDLAITSGTLAIGSVVVRQERPIEWVIPALRAELGL